jgi:hypothetical protein
MDRWRVVSAMLLLAEVAGRSHIDEQHEDENATSHEHRASEHIQSDGGEVSLLQLRFRLDRVYTCAHQPAVDGRNWRTLAADSLSQTSENTTAVSSVISMLIGDGEHCANHNRGRPTFRIPRSADGRTVR